jgi:hypothetical protein
MKKHTSAIIAAMTTLAAPVIMSAVGPIPTANADICAGVHGRFVGVAGCGAPIAHIATGAAIVGGAAAGVAIESAAVPYVPGEVPCYTVEGVPYYTPPGQPC